jgi:serine/threonine protein kinase/Tol biopolymer transport system component
MGEVYRATDTKLGREVALKALPAEVAQDPERLARFRREAQVLAALNHPGVAAIHGLEEAAGQPFLVLELVEGEDLSERLKRGPIPVEEAFDVARQIAEALEEAHEKGIVHRDLKPANVKRTPEGKVKVLDFGLAKAWTAEATSGSAPDLSQSPTLAHTGTAAGLILGTAAYMSPEQARGRAADKRADIWALGVVLFEMLAGRRLFEGETASDILASVIKDEPDWSALPAGTPPGAAAVLRRCLAKDPRARFRDSGDVRLLLEDATRDKARTSPTQRPSVPRWREGLAWLAAAAALTAALAVTWCRPSGPAPDAPLARFTVTLPEEKPIAFSDTPILALSPDGRAMAFAAIDPESSQSLIHLRTLDEVEPRPVPGTEGGSGPFFSPDGRSIAFFADGRLKRVPVAGGPALALADSPTARGGVWAEDDTIYFSPEYTSGLWRVASSGGAPEPVVDVDSEKGERTYRWPDLLPGGRAVLFTIGTLDSPNNFTDATIAAYSFDTGAVKVLVEGASMARFVPPGTIVYSREGILHAVPFDADRLEIVGEPQPVLEGVGGDPSSGAGYFSLARNGTLAFVPGGLEQAGGLLTVFDRSGQARRLPLAQRGLHHPRFSPDGTHLAYVMGLGSTGAGGDIWVYSLTTESLTRLTFDGQAAYPLWSPDGRSVAFNDSSVGGIVRKAADGSGTAEALTPSDPTPLLADSWSPDGRIMAYTRLDPSSDVYLIEPGKEPRLFERDASGPVISPDGRWIAYSQPASGRGRVFVRPLHGEGKWQVSPDVGGYPRWRGDGRELFYIALAAPGRPVMAVDVQPAETFQAGPSRKLFGDLPVFRFLTSTAPMVNWDAAPSGDAFVFVELDRDEAEASRIEMVLGWAQHVTSTRTDASDPGE